MSRQWTEIHSEVDWKLVRLRGWLSVRQILVRCLWLAVGHRSQDWILSKIFINGLDDGADCTFSKFVGDTLGALRGHLINVMIPEGTVQRQQSWASFHWWLATEPEVMGTSWNLGTHQETFFHLTVTKYWHRLSSEYAESPSFGNVQNLSDTVLGNWL